MATKWICMDAMFRGTQNANPQLIANALRILIVVDGDAAASGGACWWATDAGTSERDVSVALEMYVRDGGTVSEFYEPEQGGGNQ